MAKTFVLVHGAWHGGWCWRRVSDLLERQGHKVFTPTLTGLGERSHLMSKEIRLATHITDVVNHLKWEGLEGVVLCGHSYGGMVVSAVAEQMADKIASIVLLDAFVPGCRCRPVAWRRGANPKSRHRSGRRAPRRSAARRRRGTRSN